MVRFEKVTSFATEPEKGTFSMRMLALFAFFGASPAFAATSYLSCGYDRGDGVMVTLSVAADENAQQVTVTNEKSGRSERYPAVFSATAVKWGGPIGSSARVENVISRVDLSFRTQTVTFSGQVVQDSAGRCVVQEAGKRAF